jgi:seryl-tRNA synthetase
MTTLDLSKVPHLELRRKLGALIEEQAKLSDAEWEATKPLREEYEAMRDKLMAEVKKQLAPLRRRIDEIHAQFGKKMDAIDEQIEALNAPEPMLNEDMDTILFCDLTGLLILEGDEIIKDEDTGEVILRCVLPWPEDKKNGHASKAENTVGPKIPF